ncbi:MAG: RluA family pseudouridine synthase [Bacteroidales bacterium]|jgi:RluA family pseudouridine synthase|nr:RluA family pseudouridine synthase [Bacteroidales bacterium]
MKIEVKKSQSLLDLLGETFPESTKTHLKKVIKYGFVSRGDLILKNPETPVKKGETLNYKKYNGKEAQTEKAPFQIVFEDDYLIAVLKPAGILTVGTTTETKKSMYKMVLDYIVKKSKHREKIFIVHRLDREVSGLLLFAKSEAVRKSLIENWTDNEKLYWALVEGTPQPANNTIKSYVMEGPKQKMMVVEEVRGIRYDEAKPRTPHPAPRTQNSAPQLAILHYKTLSRHNDYTLLEILLETGRKNQIRVQLSSIHCSIVGDRKYGADATYIRQIRLFAFSLSFKHPVTQKRVNLSLPMPKQFLKVGKGDENYTVSKFV